MATRGSPWDRAMARALAEEFSEMVTGELDRLGMTQVELADRLGVSKTRVFQMLHADNLTLRTMAATMDALGRRLVIRSVAG